MEKAEDKEKDDRGSWEQHIMKPMGAGLFAHHYRLS